ncbi:hypothetical protein L484_005373 [Morus notabilis]|uniref:Uncharacterized protein n=1 Tax=Morus notabilis TaxID=981085 RepID=W9SCM0_9ROSA|nr:hypothetical protein L484_005373 [Morus notabilis]
MSILTFPFCSRGTLDISLHVQGHTRHFITTPLLSEFLVARHSTTVLFPLQISKGKYRITLCGTDTPIPEPFEQAGEREPDGQPNGSPAFVQPMDQAVKGPAHVRRPPVWLNDYVV